MSENKVFRQVIRPHPEVCSSRRNLRFKTKEICVRFPLQSSTVDHVCPVLSLSHSSNRRRRHLLLYSSTILNFLPFAIRRRFSVPPHTY